MLLPASPPPPRPFDSLELKLTSRFRRTNLSPVDSKHVTVRRRSLMFHLKRVGTAVAAIGALALVASIGAQQEARRVNVDANVLKNAGTSHDALPGDWLSY